MDPNTDGFVNGEYEEIILSKGDKIDRFGGNNGTFFGKIGDTAEQRALSPKTDMSQYNKYEVLKDIKVRKGDIAPWFDRPGGGTQYKLDPEFVYDMRNMINNLDVENKPQLIDFLIQVGFLRRL